MLEIASRQAALLEDSDRPFVMDLDFTVQVNPPLQGHMRLRWEAKDRWWSRVSMGKFEQIKFQTGEWTYTLRNVDFTPIQVRDLFDLLHVGYVYNKLVPQAGNPRREGGANQDCLKAHNPDPIYKRESFEICVDSTTHDVVSQTRTDVGYAKDDVAREQFSDFVDFGGHRYPRKLESLRNGQLVMSATVMGLQESPLDPKLLVPPAGAIERRVCPDKFKGAESIEDPMPSAVRGHFKRIETAAEVTIMTDGSVGHVAIVQSAGPTEDEAAIEALKRWTFKPAMCGTEPVVADQYEILGIENPWLR